MACARSRCTPPWCIRRWGMVAREREKEGRRVVAVGHHARLLWQPSHGDSKSGPRPTAIRINKKEKIRYMRVGVAAGGTRAHCHLRSCRISHSPIAVLVCVRGICVGSYIPYLSTQHSLSSTHNIQGPPTMILYPPQWLLLNVFQIVGRRFKPCNLVSWSDVSPVFVWIHGIVFPSDFRGIPGICQSEFAQIFFLTPKAIVHAIQRTLTKNSTAVIIVLYVYCIISYVFFFFIYKKSAAHR